MNAPTLHWISGAAPPHAFPPLGGALREPDGLLAAGGDLSEERLLYAYRSGIFPWYDEGQPILWWSPDPRCVLSPAAIHVSRRLSRTLRNSDLTVSFNRAFDDVLASCAAPRRTDSGTWITGDMAIAYGRLHRHGWAHSIEVMQGEKLVGGLYGLAMGRVFFGESMFSEVSDASKVALLALCRVLESHRFALLDCQVASAHLMSMGAELKPRDDFKAILDRHCDAEPFTGWPAEPLRAAELPLTGSPERA